MVSFKPLVNAWEGAIKAAEKTQEPWRTTANICREFYSGSVGFMWDSKFRNKYLRNMPETKFEITIAKAFELVSIVGPTLMWNYPGRIATGYEKLQIPAEFWGDPNLAQQWQQSYSSELATNTARNELMQHYLNYSQREQPGGGLKTDCQMAIIDSLITGRGVIRVDPYEPVGGPGKLTGGFYVKPDNLLIDPDCSRANLTDASWIAIKHCQPHWRVERQFGWPAGSLKGKSKTISRMGAANQSQDKSMRGQQESQDLVEWYEVFSKCGAGQRFKSCNLPEWKDALEQIGDYCYLAIIPGSNEILNLRTEFIETASMDQVKAAIDWPTPYYKDGRWPVALLDYWLIPDKPWPMAPLAMGLGELIFLNVFISSLADKIFQDGLVKAAIRTEVAEDAIAKLTSYKHEVLSLNPAIAGNINELVSYLQRPQTNFDAFRMVEYVSMMFDKRVGLTELMYGMNQGGKVSRTAADANIKGEAVSVRPEFMASQVEAWQTEIANLERIAAGWHVSGETLTPLLGQMGGQLWTQLITDSDPIVFLREMRMRIEANSIRKPNKSKENQNIQQLGAFLLPMLQWYAQTTGNTEPLNGFLNSAGRAIDQDVDAWLLPPINQQQPSEEEMMAQQEAQELEKAKRVADVQGRDLKNRKLAHEMMMGGQGQEVNVLDEIEIDTGDMEPGMPEMPPEMMM